MTNLVENSFTIFYLKIAIKEAMLFEGDCGNDFLRKLTIYKRMQGKTVTRNYRTLTQIICHARMPELSLHVRLLKAGTTSLTITYITCPNIHSTAPLV